MLLFEKSVEERGNDLISRIEVPLYRFKNERNQVFHLPSLSESDCSRHYTELASKTHGVNKGFYPLGSCTMKYNPKINEDTSKLFSNLHPLADLRDIQGALHLLADASKVFEKITGMEAFTFQPAAGAHGEFCGLALIKAYHESRKDYKRTKIVVPDSAHGTNPATVSMNGMEVINITSTEDGYVDLQQLKAVVGEDTAGLMLTNPNTLGLFDKNVVAITKIVHEAGGLCYYDGANMNAIMGITRPGDMGFDVIHLNLHKSFSTPHGGGGPGSGPVGCKQFLAQFLPNPSVIKQELFEFKKNEHSIGKLHTFYGNFLVVVKAFTYVLTLGEEGIKEVANNAVLNANYMMEKLKDLYKIPTKDTCMHEFVVSLEDLKEKLGVSATDIAKGLLDYGIHPPTMYFPLIVHEALMIEPTETESKETLDEAIEVFRKLYREATVNPAQLQNAPYHMPIKRPDEVRAARNPILRYFFDD